MVSFDKTANQLLSLNDKLPVYVNLVVRKGLQELVEFAAAKSKLNFVSRSDRQAKSKESELARIQQETCALIPSNTDPLRITATFCKGLQVRVCADTQSGQMNTTLDWHLANTSGYKRMSTIALAVLVGAVGRLNLARAAFLAVLVCFCLV